MGWRGPRACASIGPVGKSRSGAGQAEGAMSKDCRLAVGAHAALLCAARRAVPPRRSELFERLQRLKAEHPDMPIQQFVSEVVGIGSAPEQPPRPGACVRVYVEGVQAGWRATQLGAGIRLLGTSGSPGQEAGPSHPAPPPIAPRRRAPHHPLADLPRAVGGREREPPRQQAGQGLGAPAGPAAGPRPHRWAAAAAFAARHNCCAGWAAWLPAGGCFGCCPALCHIYPAHQSRCRPRGAAPRLAPADAALRHIAAICGPRYDPNRGELKLTSDRYPHREANRAHILRVGGHLPVGGLPVAVAAGGLGAACPTQWRRSASRRPPGGLLCSPSHGTSPAPACAATPHRCRSSRSW